MHLFVFATSLFDYYTIIGFNLAPPSFIDLYHILVNNLCDLILGRLILIRSTPFNNMEDNKTTTSGWFIPGG